MEPFSNENFELKVYLKYIIDTSKNNKHQKCTMDYIEEQNTEELEKFADKYEFTYVNLKRLETKDEQLKPLMNDFIELYEKVLEGLQGNEEQNIIKKKELILEGNDNNE